MVAVAPGKADAAVPSLKRFAQPGFAVLVLSRSSYANCDALQVAVAPTHVLTAVMPALCSVVPSASTCIFGHVVGDPVVTQKFRFARITPASDSAWKVISAR